MNCACFPGAESGRGQSEHRLHQEHLTQRSQESQGGVEENPVCEKRLSSSQQGIKKNTINSQKVHVFHEPEALYSRFLLSLRMFEMLIVSAFGTASINTLLLTTSSGWEYIRAPTWHRVSFCLSTFPWFFYTHCCQTLTQVVLEKKAYIFK